MEGKMKKELSHTDKQGNAGMVDVAHKPDQVRTAIAQGFIKLKPETIKLIQENAMKKGDVLTVAEIAGIQAAKNTSNLIPLCHPLIITKVDINTSILEDGIKVQGTVRCTGKTGVEMEALTGVSIALLTIYDMCKAVDRSMVLYNIGLVQKTKE